MSIAPASLDDHSVYRLLFAAYPDSLLVCDAHGTVVLANPSAAALLGYTSTPDHCSVGAGERQRCTNADSA